MDITTFKACILGIAVGDALGVPVEFESRAELDKNPVCDMRGFGSHGVPAGAWSDDTSMVLCELDALAKEHFSWDDVMKNFADWRYNGAFTPTGRCFDIGMTCEAAIRAYAHDGKAATECGLSGEHDNGNGALMRIAPFALFSPDDPGLSEKGSTLTHATRRSQIACGVYSLVLGEIIMSKSKASARLGIAKARERYCAESEWQHFEPLADIENRSRESIKSGGYVVATLEAALWCLLTTDTYRDCVLTAVNLGRDTDTVAAVAGGLAGALYGLDGIPKPWLDTLIKREYIERLSERAYMRLG